MIIISVRPTAFFLGRSCRSNSHPSPKLAFPSREVKRSQIMRTNFHWSFRSKLPLVGSTTACVPCSPAYASVPSSASDWLPASLPALSLTASNTHSRAILTKGQTHYFYTTRPSFCALQQIARNFSTTSSNNRNGNDETTTQSNKPQKVYKLLYHRPPSRSGKPRYALLFSTFNLTYWLWYILDFTPSVNASAQARFALGEIDELTLNLLTVDGSMGLLGLGVATLIWGGSVMYPRHLIAGIWKSVEEVDDSVEGDVGSAGNAGRRGRGERHGSRHHHGRQDRKNHPHKKLTKSQILQKQNEAELNSTIAISTLQLPFVTQSPLFLKTQYHPDDNQFQSGVESLTFTQEELEQDGSVQFFHGSKGERLMLVGDLDKTDLINKCDGDFGKKKGHLGLRKVEDREEKSDGGGMSDLFFKKNYLLDVGSSDEIVPGGNEHLMKSLVYDKEYFLVATQKGRRER